VKERTGHSTVRPKAVLTKLHEEIFIEQSTHIMHANVS
jgi:hypothetical protein